MHKVIGRVKCLVLLSIISFQAVFVVGLSSTVSNPAQPRDSSLSPSVHGVTSSTHTSHIMKMKAPAAEVSVRSLPDVSPSSVGKVEESIGALAGSDSVTPTGSVVSVIDPGTQTGDSQTTKIIKGFGGHQYTIFNPVAPPDPQVAAGQTHVLQMVNSFGGIWTKQGTSVKTFYLYTFFGVSYFDYISDPKVLFDAQSQRWFASEMDITTNSIRLAVSKSEDPTGNWWIYDISAAPNMPDQPILGLSDDKIVLSSNDFFGSGCASHGSPCYYVGVEYWVFNKVELISGSAVYSSFGPYSNLVSVHPVRSLSATTTQYMVSTSTGILQLFSATGLPPDPVVVIESNLMLNALSFLPDAAQKGSSLLLDTVDRRVQSSVWYEGRLWLSLNNGCVPSGDTQVRSCARIVQVDTVENSVLQDFDVGISGKYIFFPALSTDGFGNLQLILGYSSSTDYPGLLVSEQMLGDPANTIRPLQVLQSGRGPETAACTSTSCRYGDYFGTGLDPSDPTLAWVTGEFGGSSGGQWGTYIAGISAYRRHEPIIIQGNTGFTNANGVAGGNGTSANPYIIEGWAINASSAHGIQIQDTTDYFKIRDVFIHSGRPNNHNAIFLRNATVSIFSDIWGPSVEITRLSDNWIGVQVETSYVHVSDSSIYSNGYGINAFSSSVDLVRNDVSSNFVGISASYANFGIIAENNLSSNSYCGICVYTSSAFSIANNTLSGNRIGVRLSNSEDALVTQNVFYSNGLLIEGSALTHFNSHTITVDNLVNGEPLYYYKDCGPSLSVDDILVGQLIVVNCSNVVVANLQISNATRGIQMAFVEGALITNNRFSGHSQEGMYLHSSNNITISGNDILDNGLSGLVFSGYQAIIIGNNITRNGDGIRLASVSRLVTISNNNISSNNGAAVVSTSKNATITGNVVWNNQNGLVFDGAINVTITDNDIAYNTLHGVLLESSLGVTITGNNFWGNQNGLTIDPIVRFVAYHNNFISNVMQVHEGFPSNENTESWNAAYPLGGNYWSDNTGLDNCGGVDQNICPAPDGISDTPYVIDAYFHDVYPLMTPFVQDEMPPSWETGSSLTVSNIGPTRVSLTWSLATDNVALAGYRLYQDDTLIVILPGILNTYDVTGLEPGVSYTFGIEAIDRAGSSANGPSTTATTLSLVEWADYDNNGIVNIVDIAEAAACFGQSQTSLSWSNCSYWDIDSDDMVGIVDIAFAAAEFERRV